MRVYSHLGRRLTELQHCMGRELETYEIARCCVGTTACKWL